MAYPKSSSASFGADSLTINYSADEDDFMFLIHSRQYGSAPSTPSGWTALTYTSVTEGGGGNLIWYRRATASEPTSVTVAATSTFNNHGVQWLSFGGVDTTTAFDVTQTSRSSSSGSTADAASITPVTADTLIVYLCIPNDKTMIPEPGPIKILRSGTAPSIKHGDIYSYYTYGKGASVAVPAHTFVSEIDQNINPTIVTIALRDDGNGNNKGYVDVTNPPVDILHLLGTNGDTGHLTGTAQTDISSTVTSLQGVTTSNNTNTQGAQQKVLEAGFLSAGYSTNFAAQNCAIIGSTLSTAIDIETDIVSFTSQGDPTFYQSYGDLAKHIGFGDGTNYRFFRVDAADAQAQGSESPVCIVLEIDGGFETEEVGTVTSTVLQNIDYIAMGGPANATYDINGYGFLYRHNTMLILGGSANFPTGMNTAIECARTSSLRTVSDQNGQSVSQYYCAHKIQFGDGTTPINCSFKDVSVDFAAQYDEAAIRIQTQVSEGVFGITFKLTSSCVVDLRGNFKGGDFHEWGLESGSSTSATITENGGKVISHNPKLQPIGRAWTGVTFQGCRRVAMNGADVSGGCIFDDSTDTTSSITPLSAANQAALQLLLDDIANCTFSNNPVGIRIEYTGASAPTVNFDAITVSGNTVDLHFNATNAVQLTANMQNGSNITTTAVSGSATGVTISNDVTFTITVNVSGAEITFLERGTQTEVYHVETGSTTQGYTYTYSSDTDIDIQVFKQGYKPYWNDQETLTSSNQTVNVVLEDEPASQI